MKYPVVGYLPIPKEIILHLFKKLLIEFVKLNFNHGYPKIDFEIDYDDMVEEFALLSAHMTSTNNSYMRLKWIHKKIIKMKL